VRKKTSVDNSGKAHPLHLRLVNLQPTRDSRFATKDGERLVDRRDVHGVPAFPPSSHGDLAYNILQLPATSGGALMMAKRGNPSLHPSQVANRSPEAIGHRLKLVRNALGLTQEQIAESIASPQGTWGQYEAGMRKPSVAVASRLYDRYRISLDYIYLGDASNLPFDLGQKVMGTK
jgi:DNA-binding XRE family transcriptional regulator